MFEQLLLLTLIQRDVSRAELFGFHVHSFSSEKERTKKAASDVPSEATLGIAALQSKQRRKTYPLLLHLSPHSHHERQTRKAKVFF